MFYFSRFNCIILKLFLYLFIYLLCCLLIFNLLKNIFKKQLLCSCGYTYLTKKNVFLSMLKSNFNKKEIRILQVKKKIIYA